MRFRLLALLVAAIAFVGGCAGDEAPTAAAVPETSAQPSPASAEAAPSADLDPIENASATGTPLTVDGWEQSTANLVTAGIATQSDNPVEAPEVHAIGATSQGHLVAGSVNGGFAVWRSEDLESFEPVYSEICCDRYLRASSIAEFDGTLLIGGTGEFGLDRTEQAFILRSDDGGASWALIDDPLFTTDANRIDRMIVTDDAVLVEALDDRRAAAGPQSLAVWSDDLSTWHPVELQGRKRQDWPWFVEGAGAVFAVAQRYEGPEGRFDRWVIWRSDDGGRRFTALPGLPDPDVRSFLAVGDTLVAVPSVYQDEYHHTDARGLLVLEGFLEGGGAWRELEPDTGTWGDGRVSAYPTAASRSSGRTYTLVTRETRASVHYCYDDVATCQQLETALLATEDGLTWHDVAGIPTGGAGVIPMSLDVDGAGGLVMVAASHLDPHLRITRWTSDSPPPTIDRPDYAAPDIPVPLYDPEEPFDVGDERRYALGLGGCGGMYVDGQRWAPDEPLPDPGPDWPYRSVEIADGPSGFVYGRIHRLTSDTIGFSTEGVGTVATFHPAPPDDTFCG